MTANILNFYVYFNTVFQIQFQDGLTVRNKFSDFN